MLLKMYPPDLSLDEVSRRSYNSLDYLSFSELAGGVLLIDTAVLETPTILRFCQTKEAIPISSRKQIRSFYFIGDKFCHQIHFTIPVIVS